MPECNTSLNKRFINHKLMNYISEQWLRPLKINALFLILRARSFLSDYGKNKGKKEMFIFHFLIKIIVPE